MRDVLQHHIGAGNWLSVVLDGVYETWCGIQSMQAVAIFEAADS